MHLFCKQILFPVVVITILLLSNITIAAKLNPIKGAVFMKADRIEYDESQEIIVATGNIVVEFDNYRLSADYIYYDIKYDQLFAEGGIRAEDAEGNLIIGEKAVFKDKLKKGIIDEFILRFDDSYLIARLAERIDENRSYLYKATFTPCDIHCGREPIWKISAQDTLVDFEQSKITYSNVFFQVYGVPVVYLPYFTHPTADAQPHSGLLNPTIKKNSLVIPLYFRIRENFDFTVSPRLAENYTIFEYEIRHKLKEGSYEVQGSIGDTPRQLEQQGKIVKDTKAQQYHVFAKGDFKHNDLNYGFDIRRTSPDKAYLKNYHQIFDSYLTSKIFINKVNRKNYFSINGLYFQELRDENIGDKMPFIFPSFNYKAVVPVTDDESATVSIVDNMMLYNESYIKQIGRNAFEITAAKNIITNSGQMINFGISNRSDYYYTNIRDENGINNERILFRNIPETFLTWRYPLILDISSKTSMKVEPIISGTLGRSYEDRFGKFGLIDSSKFDISEETLFNHNRFSGIDFHEYGKRINYGGNLSLYSESIYLNSFLGQAIHKDNVISNNNYEYVGSASLELVNTVFAAYKFRKDKKLSPIRDELEVGYIKNPVSLGARLVTLHNITRYFANDDFATDNNKLKNASLKASYQLGNQLFISGSTVYDLSSKRKYKQLKRTISVTYFKDCVRVSGKFTNDYTQDKGRGVKKGKSHSFSIKLKVLNFD